MVKSRIILSLLLILCSFQFSFSHPWKPSHYVVIDTDGGIDDFKAINMLLASRDVRVLAIIASGGTLDAGETYIKIKSLLNSYYHEGLPVGINKNIKGENFQLPLTAIYGEEEGIVVPASSDFIEIVQSVVTGETSPIKLISLGSLNSAWQLIEKGVVFEGVYWSIESISPATGMNFDLDRTSAERVISGKVPLHAVGYTGENTLYSDELIIRISAIRTRYAESVYRLTGNGSPLSDHPFVKRGTDEMIPLFLHYPELFTTVENGNTSFSLPSIDGEFNDAVIRILKGETVSMNQVVNNFPTDSSFYMTDIQPYVRTIIETHGIEEWSSGVLANELHRHLGIFAIVGVKMGIRAREYFHTGVDEMNVISSAASTPPLSCMNDGLQVSTGATPGHGLLTVINDSPAPYADFRYKGKSLRIGLKPGIKDVITAELKEINYIYGLDSNIYWELVRQKSILYWKNLDRHDIFDITELE